MKKKAQENYLKLTRNLINSASWRNMSINCKRLLDCLIEDHLRHAGKQNGDLKATYDQLVEANIPRRLISRTISEAEYLGLVTVERGGRRGCVNDVNTFTLTFAPFFQKGRWYSPPDDWEKVTEEDIKEYQRIHKIKSNSKLRYATVTVS